MKFVTWDMPGIHYDDPNLYWGNPSYLLEPGEPGYVADPTSASFPKSSKSKRKYKMANPTPTSIGDLIAAGEDLCDGLDPHAVAINVKQNTAAVSRADLTALATTLHAALSTARVGVAHALSNTKAKLLLRDTTEAAFRMRYRGVIAELEQLLSDEDPKWYGFGLNRPADPSTPGVPGDVTATALAGGRVLVQVGFARRANSFNYYKQVTGTDAAPVKVLNTEGTQHTLEGLPAGATVKITVTGVNDGGEGVASDPVSVVVT